MNPRLSRYYTYIKPIIRNQKVQTYSSLVFSLVMIAIFSVFAIKPTLSTIVSLQKSIKEQQSILDQLTTKSKNLSAGRNNYQAISVDTKQRIDSLLPTKANIPELMAELTALANRYDASVSALQLQPLDLDLISTGNPQPSQEITQKDISFTINLSGNYAQLTGLLKDLSTLRRLVAIDTMNFNHVEDGGLILNINARALYAK